MNKREYSSIRWNWLLKEWEGRCAYCGGVPDTEDHIIPRSKGGVNAWWNLLPCCWSCNQLKADRPLKEFLKDNKKKIKQIYKWKSTLPKSCPFSNLVTYDEVANARMIKYDRFGRR